MTIFSLLTPHNTRDNVRYDRMGNLPALLALRIVKGIAAGLVARKDI